MGLGARISVTISPRVRFCAAVGWNGRTSRMALADFVVGRKCDSGAFAHAAAFQLKAQLEEEQLFKDQAAMSRRCPGLQLRERSAFRRKVHFAQRGFAIGHVEPGEHRLPAGTPARCRACYRAG